MNNDYQITSTTGIKIEEYHSIDLYSIFFKSTFFPNIQGVSAKTFEPNISVICQRIFMKFKTADLLDREDSI
jgi:hypothetical protein